MEWLNHNSGALTAIATFAMLLATVAYVIVNSWMHREMRRSRQNNERPSLSLRLDRVSSGFFDLVIENLSPNPAYNVHFTEYPKLEETGLSPSRTPGFFTKGIHYMSPGQKYRSFFLHFPAVAHQGSLGDLSVAYEFFDRSGLKYTERITFNLSAIHNMLTLGAGVEIHENLAAIQKELVTLNKLIKSSLPRQH